jgi:hypothetical protein
MRECIKSPLIHVTSTQPKTHQPFHDSQPKITWWNTLNRQLRPQVKLWYHAYYTIELTTIAYITTIPHS